MKATIHLLSSQEVKQRVYRSYGKQILSMVEATMDKKLKGYQTLEAERLLQAIINEIDHGNFSCADYLMVLFVSELANCLPNRLDLFES